MQKFFSIFLAALAITAIVGICFSGLASSVITIAIIGIVGITVLVLGGPNILFSFFKAFSGSKG